MPMMIIIKTSLTKWEACHFYCVCVCVCASRRGGNGDLPVALFHSFVQVFFIDEVVRAAHFVPLFRKYFLKKEWNRI